MLHFQLPRTSGGNLLEHLLVESIDALRGGAIFAWANASGTQTLLQDSVMDELLTRTDFRLIVGTDSITDTKAVDKLRSIEKFRPRFHVRAFLSPASSLFHPKMAWFEHRDYVTLIVGSGNLTMGGLLSNWEAMVVVKLSGHEADEALQTIESFITTHSNYLLPLSDERVTARVAANVGNERNLKNGGFTSISTTATEATDEVLIAEIPASGDRWKQANFDQDSYESFFGAKRGTQRRIVLRNVTSSGLLGELESRPSIEVASSNFRFELAAAAGLPYPTQGPPIGVFVRLATGQFIYQLSLPGDASYVQLDEYLSKAWQGSSRNKRRVRTDVETLREYWQDSALWKVAWPEL